MKHYFIFLMFIFSSTSFLKAQNEFITVWKPSNTGIIPSQSTSTQIYFPGLGNNYTIYWEEVGYPAHNATINNVTSALNVPLLIDFGNALNPIPTNATYELKVRQGSGNFHRICFYAPTLIYRGDSHKIINIKQWGDIAWSSMERAFHFCNNMDVTATDLPNLTQLNNMNGMFFDCNSLVGNITFGNWNVSNVTNFSQCFTNTYLFNQPVNNWNMSNAVNISYMFGGCNSFNQPVGVWDTSNVQDMSGVFFNNLIFNQPLSNWNTSRVTNMSALFSDTEVFNQPIENWDTSKITNMSYLFSSSKMFNQPIQNWDTSKVTNMQAMFLNTESFNQPINNWNTSLVTDMSAMFRETDSFNQPISNWNTSLVTNMKDMFANATKFNQPIGNWNTSLVTDMSHMFFGALLFNQPIGSWNTSNVTNMFSMFSNAPVFNRPLTNWNTSSVNDMRMMFKQASSFNQNLGFLNLSSVVQLTSMLDLSGLSCSNYNSTLQGWSANNLTPSNLSLGASGLKYSTTQATASRNNLITNKSWIITGDYFDAECDPLSTSESTKTQLSLYPNPVKNKLFFSEKLTDIAIFTIDGRLLIKKNNGNDINLSELPNGIYILKAETQTKEKIMRKIIKE